MGVDFVKAIVPGVIVGIFAGFLMLLAGCCSWPFDAILFALAGAAAVYWAGAGAADGRDVTMTGACSGGAAGFVAWAMNAVIAGLLISMYAVILSDVGVSWAPALIGGGVILAICLPIYVVAGAALGIVGGHLCQTRLAKW